MNSTHEQIRNLLSKDKVDFKELKNKIITMNFQYLKKLKQSGYGDKHIQNEKKRILDIMKCQSIGELFILEENYLSTNIEVNLVSKNDRNNVKQFNKKEALRLKLKHKFIRKSN